jgi:hypothetical protein
MTEPITIADSQSWTMHEEVHINGGATFFAYLHRCDQQPRLSRYDRYQRSDRQVISTFRVDGVDQTDMAAAVDALNAPPTFSPAELTLLGTISDEPTNRRKEMIAGYVLWNGLKEKGAVAWERGLVSRTALGRDALIQGAAS